MDAQSLSCLFDPTLGTSSELFAQCMTSIIPEIYEGLRAITLLTCAALVFFMQAGFAMVCAGVVRTKNVQNSMLKNLLDACGSALAFYCFGYAFAFGDGGTFIGSSNFCLIGLDESQYLFWLFQFMFAATSATIVAGALAERCQMTAYFVYSFVLSGLVYPVVVRSMWSEEYGFMRNLWRDGSGGAVDFAGSGVVHMTGGFTALIGAWLLGPRKGRFSDPHTGLLLEEPAHLPGHSVALQMLGSFTLWFGWYGFNCGSALTYSSSDTISVIALAAVNTTLAAGAGGIVSLFTRLFITERRTGEVSFDASAAMNGSLSGIVSITAGCALVPTWAAIIIGAIAGLVYVGSSSLLLRFRIDDVVDAIPVHFFNGLWGIICTGLFATPEHMLRVYGKDNHAGLFMEWGRGRSDAYLLVAQFIFILFVISWVSLVIAPFLFWLKYIGWLRSDALEEVVGLDVSYHGREGVQDDSIGPEYLEAYFVKRVEKKRTVSRRRSSDNDSFNNGTVSITD